MPGRPIPDDLLATGKEQLHRAFLRSGAPHLPGILQMLGLPAVAQRKPDAARAEPVLLQRNRVFEQLVHNAHVWIPALFLGLRLRDELGDRVVGQPALSPILSDFLHQRSVRYSVEDCIALALVDMAPPREARRDKDVVGMPSEARSADLGHALTFDCDVEGAGGFSFEPGRLAGS